MISEKDDLTTGPVMAQTKHFSSNLSDLILLNTFA